MQDTTTQVLDILIGVKLNAKSSLHTLLVQRIKDYINHTNIKCKPLELRLSWRHYRKDYEMKLIEMSFEYREGAIPALVCIGKDVDDYSIEHRVNINNLPEKELIKLYKAIKNAHNQWKYGEKSASL